MKFKSLLIHWLIDWLIDKLIHILIPFWCFPFQASKLGLSKNKTIICSFPSYQVFVITENICKPRFLYQNTILVNIDKCFKNTQKAFLCKCSEPLQMANGANIWLIWKRNKSKNPCQFCPFEGVLLLYRCITV